MGNTLTNVIAFPEFYTHGSMSFGRHSYEAMLLGDAYNPEDTEDVDLTGKVFIITGAANPVDLEAAKVIVAKGATLHFFARDEATGKKVQDSLLAAKKEAVVFMHVVDVADFDAIREFAKTFSSTYRKLDCLINTLCDIPIPERYEITMAGHERIMASTLGTCHLLTSLMLPLLQVGAVEAVRDTKINANFGGRVINVTSASLYLVKGPSPKDLDSQHLQGGYGGHKIYSLAARAMVSLTEVWSLSLTNAGRSVTVNAVNPGWCADLPGTPLLMPNFAEALKGGGTSALRTHQQGADTIVWLAVAGWQSGKAPAGRSGQLWCDRAPHKSHLMLAKTSSTPEELKELFHAASEYTGAVTLMA